MSQEEFDLINCLKLEPKLGYTGDMISKAFRKQALIHHPDKVGSNVEEFKKINNCKDDFLELVKRRDQLNQNKKNKFPNGRYSYNST
jgi:curved DNA-binding protein CbpA